MQPDEEDSAGEDNPRLTRRQMEDARFAQREELDRAHWQLAVGAARAGFAQRLLEKLSEVQGLLAMLQEDMGGRSGVPPDVVDKVQQAMQGELSTLNPEPCHAG